MRGDARTKPPPTICSSSQAGVRAAPAGTIAVGQGVSGGERIGKTGGRKTLHLAEVLAGTLERR